LSLSIASCFFCNDGDNVGLSLSIVSCFDEFKAGSVTFGARLGVGTFIFGATTGTFTRNSRDCTGAFIPAIKAVAAASPANLFAAWRRRVDPKMDMLKPCRDQ
jgi:hypothetical protein